MNLELKEGVIILRIISNQLEFRNPNQGERWNQLKKEYTEKEKWGPKAKGWNTSASRGKRREGETSNRDQEATISKMKTRNMYCPGHPEKRVFLILREISYIQHREAEYKRDKTWALYWWYESLVTWTTAVSVEWWGQKPIWGGLRKNGPRGRGNV